MSCKSLVLLILALIPSVLFEACDQHLGDEDTVGPPWIVYTKVNTKGGLVNDRINSIYVDGGNKKWFATDGGASVYSRTGWLTYTTDLQFITYSQGGTTVSRKVNAIINGTDGSMWFGLAGGGVKRYFAVGGSQPWTTYKSPTISDVVVALAVDRFGEIYCGTTYGVYRFKPSTSDPIEGIWNEYLPSNSGLPSSFVHDVKANFVTNNIWFGTEYGDLVSFDGVAQWLPYNTPEGAQPITSIAHEGSSLVWVGTDDGAFSFSQTTGWTRYTTTSTDSGLPSNFVRSVIVDIDGNKWFGTEKGLARLNQSGWTTFNHLNSPIPSDLITSLAIDNKRNLWIGTLKGVAVFNESGVRK